ncbi:uncharacterized protein LOC131847358 [Achroia grisella]|uniref:uncharacterized protein LOC131847358 n=1 Tax=Achroia grisella TaxID=688607 RepID=UPI0027D2E7A9|nr:uncharacterized protein LOC131847358 [Achroia grisella]
MANTINTLKTKEREFIIDCIHLYRDLPALWNTKSQIYHDRSKKRAAYDLLLTKYKELYPDSTKEDVKRKFNILRTNYRKELKRYNESKNFGNTNTNYIPSLWYFEEMSFLNDQDVSLDAIAADTRVFKVNSEVEGTCSENSRRLPSIINKHSTKKSRIDEPFANFAHECLNGGKLINSTCERGNNEKDEYYHWAMACAADIRKMETTQRLYAKKAIADVIMEGQLGLLHRHSC